MTAKPEINPIYAGIWGALLAAMVLGEFISYPPWAWPVLAIVFVGTELVALVVNRALGDTFSEMAWAFVLDKKDRRPVVWAVAVYLPLRITMLTIDFVPTWLPPSILALGIVGWLIPHFTHFGRQG